MRSFLIRLFASVLLTGSVVTGAFAQPTTEPTAQPAQSSPQTPAQGAPEKRIAFVVGDESYADGALPTAANDAGLVAQTLQAAGFEVVGARDLDAETLRQSYSDFLKRVSDAGPNTAAFVYLAGYGLQYGTDNYYVPIGAKVTRLADIPIESIRLTDFIGPLAAAKLKASFFVFDAAYKTPFNLDGAAVAGFSLVDAQPGTLIAFNAAPGTVAPPGKGNYGLFAQSLSAELRDGGLTPDEIFDRVRLRVSDTSKGAEVPWDVSKIDASFRFFERGAGAPPPAATPEQMTALTEQPIKALPVKEAYSAAVARDTVTSYSDFVAAYGSDPLARRARVLLAARREAITWRRTIVVDTPAAYWSYLSRYPHGPHAADARLRLEELSAVLAPPPSFEAIVYDVPPPPPEELVYVDRPIIYFDDPGYDFEPPPPPPEYWLPPVPVAFIDLPPPPPPIGLFFLPIPAFVPLPVYYDPPAYVAYPTSNYFYGGYGGDRGGDVFINNRTVVNNIHTSFPGGGPRGGQGGGFGQANGQGNGQANGGANFARVALPGAAEQRANVLQQRGITTPQQLDAARRNNGGAIQPGANGIGNRLQTNAPNNRPGADAARGGAAVRNDLARPNERNAAERNAADRNGAERNGAERNAVRNGQGARNEGARSEGARNEGARNEGARNAAARGEAARRGAGAAAGAGARNAEARAQRADRNAARAAQRQERRDARASRGAARRAERAGGQARGALNRAEANRGGGPARGGAERFARPGGPARSGGRPEFGGGGPRPNFGGGGGPRPNFGGGGGPRPNFGGGGGPRPGGFGGGGPRPNFGGGGGPRPGGFGGGGPRPGGFGGGGPRPGGGGGPHPGGPGGPHL